MISLDDAIELIRSVASPLGAETVALSEAAGRVLSGPVRALIDSPRQDCSSMDGYAVREADLTALPIRLTVVGESFAGAGWTGTLAAGTCIRIFTGAPLPAGADRVVVQEEVHRDDEIAVFATEPGPARHVRKRACDFGVGEELLSKGRLFDPRAIVAAAAADVAAVEVFRRPRVSILSTGDELAEPGTAKDRPYAVPESVSVGVEALAKQWGAECLRRVRLPDDPAPMQAAAASALEDADVIVVTGGASVGERDFAKDMFEPLGLELIFSKVAIKPGKPVWFGRVGGRFVLGLPGNPTSALVTARLFLAPLLAYLQGRAIHAALAWKAIPLASAIPSNGPRETFHRASISDGAVQVFSSQDSGAQKVLAEADTLVRQPAHCPSMPHGAAVQVLDF